MNLGAAWGDLTKQERFYVREIVEYCDRHSMYSIKECSKYYMLIYIDMEVMLDYSAFYKHNCPAVDGHKLNGLIKKLKQAKQRKNHETLRT